MQWGKIFKDAVKHTLILGAVGALLALAAPVMATAIGPAILGEAAFAHAMATPVIWTAAFFGAFGGINAVVAPVVKKMLGEREESRADKKEVTVNFVVEHKGHAQGQGLTVNNHHNTVTNNDVDVLAIDASRTKNVGVDARETLKIEEKNQANVSIAGDPFAAAPSTLVTEATSRQAILLGADASRAIH